MTSKTAMMPKSRNNAVNLCRKLWDKMGWIATLGGAWSRRLKQWVIKHAGASGADVVLLIDPVLRMIPVQRPEATDNYFVLIRDGKIPALNFIDRVRRIDAASATGLVSATRDISHDRIELLSPRNFIPEDHRIAFRVGVDVRVDCDGPMSGDFAMPACWGQPRCRHA